MITTLLSTPRKRWLAACAACLVAGAAGGYSLRRPVTTTVSRESEQTMNESAGLDLRTLKVEEKKPVTTTRERIVYRDGPVREKVVTRIEEGGSTVTTDTQEKVHDDLRATTKDATRITETQEGRWAVRLLAGVDTHGGVVAGAAVDYRLVGPFTVGAWGSGPVAGNPAPVTVGVSVGLRL